MSVEVLTLAACERLNDTVNRNPRYRVAFRGGLVALSQSDASWTYAMGNPGMRAGDQVMVTFSRAGRIVHMEPWSGNTAGGSIAAPAVHAAMVAAIEAYDTYRRGDGYDCNGGS